MKKFEFKYENILEFYSYEIVLTFEKHSEYNVLYVINFESDHNLSMSMAKGFYFLGFYLNMIGENAFKYLITNFKFYLIDDTFCFHEEEVDKIIDWLESIKVMKKLTE